MEMRSVGQTPNLQKTTERSTEIRKKFPNASKLEDKLVKLRKEDNELNDKINILKSNISSFTRSKEVNKKAHTATRLTSLACGALFVGATIMASGPLFVTGAVVGGATYIASGWFKGRTQWFTNQAEDEQKKIGKVIKQKTKIEKETKEIDGIVTKAKEDVENMKKGLAVNTSPIQDKDEYVEIGGVKLRKNKPGVFKYLDDLFSPLEKE